MEKSSYSEAFLNGDICLQGRKVNGVRIVNRSPVPADASRVCQ